MITFRDTGARRATLPATLPDGRAHKNVAARNIKPGDAIVTHDLTGPVGVWFAHNVTDVESVKSGTGRAYVSPWNRRVIVTEPLPCHGVDRFGPSATVSRLAHDDRIDVYR